MERQYREEYVDWYDDEEPEQDEPEQEPSEDTGRYQNGYRVYRDGSYREDFGSDM